MQKETFFQLFLLLIILTISVLFYKTYFEEENLRINKIETQINKDELIIDKNNLIYSIEYISKTKKGHEYIIKSRLGIIDNDQPNLILMEDVTAIINSKDSTKVKISADNALYNRINLNTKFYENVTVTYVNHFIKSDNLVFNFQNNSLIMSDNIFYKNLNTKLQADKIEFDLLTNDLKISMKNKSKKIKIKSLN